MAPQLMATNGGVAPLAGAPRREKYSRWIACAASSLPVPVSPSINTAAGERAYSMMVRRVCSICGESPCKSLSP